MKKSTIFKIIIIIFFLALIYIFTKIGINEIIQSIAKANPLWVFISFLSLAIMFLFWSLRLKFLLKSKISLIKFFMLNIMGTFICMITPTAGAGGEPVKAYYVSKMEKRKFADTLIITILDKAIFNNIFFFLSIIASLIYMFLSIKMPLEIKTFLTLLLFITGAAIIVGIIVKLKWETAKKPLTKILMVIYNFRFINKRFKTFNHFKDLLKSSAIDLFKNSKEYLTSRKILVPASLYTLVAWIFFYFSFYALFLAIDVHIGILPLFVIVTLSKLISDIAFIPGGVGITESTLIGLFVLFSINPVAAVTVTIIQRGLYYIYSLILGYSFFSYLGLKEHNGH